MIRFNSLMPERVDRAKRTYLYLNIQHIHRIRTVFGNSRTVAGVHLQCALLRWKQNAFEHGRATHGQESPTAQQRTTNTLTALPPPIMSCQTSMRSMVAMVVSRRLSCASETQWMQFTGLHPHPRAFPPQTAIYYATAIQHLSTHQSPPSINNPL